MLDYGENIIYPGFLESHCHPYFAGDRLVGQARPGEVGLAEARNMPGDLYPAIETFRLNPSEAITREQALQAITINIAMAWHQEHRISSVEFGKIANMTVYDCDFLHDSLDKVAAANIIATIVDGEVVYKNNQ